MADVDGTTSERSDSDVDDDDKEESKPEISDELSYPDTTVTLTHLQPIR